MPEPQQLQINGVAEELAFERAEQRVRERLHELEAQIDARGRSTASADRAANWIAAATRFKQREGRWPLPSELNRC